MNSILPAERLVRPANYISTTSAGPDGETNQVAKHWLPAPGGNWIRARPTH